MNQFTVKAIENLKPRDKTYMVTEGRKSLIFRVQFLGEAHSPLRFNQAVAIATGGKLTLVART